ncbi:MAG: 2-hydroxyglutaryl-CoA dehydratase [Candidatus Cloacimonetes bacterium HGW-Cloacimonetes-1]|jgi:predicted CoA-substrate-specific enzyme activase|nr:MAG: 2-hydroxyglutaryl-CoA dehydratase [Candidatus Cloacimonetes bacterium HGW-Cloacimonetes-1]
MISLGLDIGSRNTKIAVYDSVDGSVVWSDYTVTEINPIHSVNRLFANVPQAICLESITLRAVTGYGRHLYDVNYKKYSEISCHTAGVQNFFPDCRTIIDIGGQDSKVISIDAKAKIRDFLMNDKCAAGTGRFLEMTALRLNCTVDDLSEIAKSASTIPHLNSTCVVFAESEIIGLMALNESPANIVRAVDISIARRIVSQMASLDCVPPMVFTGGVSLNKDLVKCLEMELNTELYCPPDPEITGALGAAILVTK